MAQENPPDSVLKWISLIYRKTQMYLNEQLLAVGLTSGQAPIILIVCQKGRVAQNQLCSKLDLDKSTVAKALARLEAQGFVTREVNPEDSRAFEICPTPKARELYPLLIQTGERWAREMTAGLTEIERAIFFELLDRVAGNVSDYFDLREPRP